LVFGTALYANSYNSSSSGSSSEKTYESSSGNKYQYDLSDQGDRLKYSVDVGAQLRDSVNPSVDLDRGLGQYGGGIKND